MVFSFTHHLLNNNNDNNPENDFSLEMMIKTKKRNSINEKDDYIHCNYTTDRVEIDIPLRDNEMFFTRSTFHMLYVLSA